MNEPAPNFSTIGGRIMSQTKQKLSPFMTLRNSRYYYGWSGL